MMGAGKSFLGKELGNRLNLPHIDLDEYIEVKSGISIEEWFETKGEPSFRDYEKVCVHSILSNYNNKSLILSLGGGTPCYSNLDLILREQSLCIFLFAETSLLASRILSDTSIRPLLTKDLNTIVLQLDRLEKSRKVIYEKAHFKVKSDQDAINSLLEILKKYVELT